MANERKQGKQPTIQDVARRAEVAVGTVSRVINNSAGVKPATRQRVLAVIEALDYSPNLIARSMTSKKTGSIGVMVPYFTRPFFSEVLHAVEGIITQAGRDFILYNVQTNEQYASYFRKLPKQQRIDGLLVVSIFPNDLTVTALKHADMPVVLVDAFHPFLTSLVVDNIAGGYQATKCLIENGHRRIGFINGITEGGFHFNRGNDRLLGMKQALADAELPFDAELVVNAEWDRQGGKRAALQLLTRANPPGAIFAASDVHAVGVLEAARALRLAVPGDLSLIGYDNIELAEILELSTIAQPIKRMGELGAQKLLAQIENPAEQSTVPEHVCLQPQLILRRTVAAPSNVLAT